MSVYDPDLKAKIEKAEELHGTLFEVEQALAAQDFVESEERYRATFGRLLGAALSSEVFDEDFNAFRPRFTPDEQELLTKFWPYLTEIELGGSFPMFANQLKEDWVYFKDSLLEEVGIAFETENIRNTYSLYAVREFKDAKELYADSLQRYQAAQARIVVAADEPHSPTKTVSEQAIDDVLVLDEPILPEMDKPVHQVEDVEAVQARLEAEREAAELKRVEREARDARRKEQRAKLKKAGLTAAQLSASFTLKGLQLGGKGSLFVGRKGVVLATDAVKFGWGESEQWRQKGTHYAVRNPFTIAAALISGASITVAAGAPSALIEQMTAAVSTFQANVDTVTEALPAQAESDTDNAPVADAVEDLDAESLNALPDYDVTQLAGAARYFNEFRYAPGQTKLANAYNEALAYQEQWQNILHADPDNAQARANLKRLTNKISGMKKPKLNDKEAALNGIKAAAIMMQGHLRGSLREHTAEQLFVLNTVKSRMESIWTPDAAYNGGTLNSALGVLQMQPETFWEAAVIHYDEVIPDQYREPFQKIMNIRDRIYRDHARRHGLTFEQVSHGSEHVRREAYSRQTPLELKQELRRAMIDSRELFVNGERTTVAGFVIAASSLMLSDTVTALPPDLVQSYGEETVRYLSHQLGNGGARQFFRDRQRIMEINAIRALPRGSAAVRTAIARHARDNPGIWRTTDRVKIRRPLLDKKGHVLKDKRGRARTREIVKTVERQATPREAMHNAVAAYRRHMGGQARSNRGIWLDHGTMRMPDAVLGNLYATYFKAAKTAATTIAAPFVSPDAGRPLTVSYNRDNSGYSLGVHLATNANNRISFISARDDLQAERSAAPTAGGLSVLGL